MTKPRFSTTTQAQATCAGLYISVIMLSLLFSVFAVAKGGKVPLVHIADDMEYSFYRDVDVPVQGEGTGQRPGPTLLTVGTDKRGTSRIFAITSPSSREQLVNTSMKIPLHKRAENFSGFTDLHSAGDTVAFMGVDSTTGIHRWHGSFTVPLSSTSSGGLCVVANSDMEIPCDSMNLGRSSKLSDHACEHGKFVAMSSPVLGSAGDVLYFAGINSTSTRFEHVPGVYEGIFRATLPRHSQSPCKANLSVILDSLGTNTPDRRIHDISAPSVSADGRIFAFSAQDGPPPLHSSQTHTHLSFHTHNRVTAPGRSQLLGGPNITIFVLKLDSEGHAILASMANKTTRLPQSLSRRPSNEETFISFSVPSVDRGRSESSVVFMGLGSLGTLGLYHLNVSSGRICTIADTTDRQFFGFDPACFSVGDGVVAFCAQGEAPETSGLYAARLLHCDDADAASDTSRDRTHVASYVPIVMLEDLPPSPKTQDGKFDYLLAREESLVGNLLAFYGAVEGGSSVGYDGIFMANLTGVMSSLGSSIRSHRDREQSGVLI